MATRKVGIPIRRYTGDRRSPKPFGRITQDTRVILASFSIRYVEMITRVSVDRAPLVALCGGQLADHGVDRGGELLAHAPAEVTGVVDDD